MGIAPGQPLYRVTAHRLLCLAGVLCVLLRADRAFGAAPVVSIEPCSLLTLAEVGPVLHGTATQDRPHVVAINNVPVGGDCSYRSAQNRLIVINVHVDAHPGGHQQKAFENARRLPHVTDLSGLGDRAFTVPNPNGPSNVTFLRGMILVTVMAQGLGIDETKQLASLVAGRLPATGGGAPASAAGSHRAPSAATTPSTPPPSSASAHSSGTLDPALIGSWFLHQPSVNRAIGLLHIKRDGTFSITLSGKRSHDRVPKGSGMIDGEHGVLHLYPDRGGHTQELRYRIVGTNQMEWTDQKGHVTTASRLPKPIGPD
jgi:hypothetical protein